MLRSKIQQGWRSIGSRRTFSCSSGSEESKGGGEIASKLTDRAIAFTGGWFLALITLKSRSREMARDADELEKELSEWDSKEDTS